MENYHSDITLNFMLNRLSRAVSSEELMAFADGIDSLEAFVDKALETAEKAEGDGRRKEAAHFYRGAEFFMPPNHPRKLEAYEKFMSLFDEVHPEVPARRRSVTFGSGELGVIDVPAIGAERDVILGCSGFDGLIEEMYATALTLARQGYRVLLYEGPGQGAALRRSHLTMIAEWEKAVTTILDHFSIESCTLMGVSLGGYLAPRAAAFEPRVKRLIAWGAMYDFQDCFRARMGDEAFKGLKQLLDAGDEATVNELLQGAMDSNTTARWSILHGMHTCGAESPFGFLTWAGMLNLREVSSNITQDTLIIGGNEDHLVPHNQLWDQASALTHAASVTVRLCTGSENAGEHCQVTNPGLVTSEIISWLDRLRQRDASHASG